MECLCAGFIYLIRSHKKWWLIIFATWSTRPFLSSIQIISRVTSNRARPTTPIGLFPTNCGLTCANRSNCHELVPRKSVVGHVCNRPRDRHIACSLFSFHSERRVCRSICAFQQCGGRA